MSLHSNNPWSLNSNFASSSTPDYSWTPPNPVFNSSSTPDGASSWMLPNPVFSSSSSAPAPASSWTLPNQVFSSSSTLDYSWMPPNPVFYSSTPVSSWTPPNPVFSSSSTPAPAPAYSWMPPNSVFSSSSTPASSWTPPNPVFSFSSTPAPAYSGMPPNQDFSSSFTPASSWTPPNPDFSFSSTPAPSSSWTRLENKLFEVALATLPEETPDPWVKIAVNVPGKSPRDVSEHYQRLQHDILLIESGALEVEFPEDSNGDDGNPQEEEVNNSQGRKPAKKRGQPWTTEEHLNFLKGLELYGMGAWKIISTQMVITKTPSQVASHAQKYFIRQETKETRRSKRKSIHDVTLDSHELEP